MKINARCPAVARTRPAGEVRIIGGSLKRSKLAVLDRRGLRPTPDRVRETVFNWLMPSLQGARVLDLCAGTGVLGTEALSRGAGFAHFNESDAELADLIAANAARLQVADRTRVTRLPAQQLLAGGPDTPFDIAFVDPPYAAGLWPVLLQRLPNWLAPGALVYLEHPIDMTSPFGPEWQVRKHAKAGRVAYFLLEQAPASASLAALLPAESAA